MEKKRRGRNSGDFQSEFSIEESGCLLSAALERQGLCLCRALYLRRQKSSPGKVRGERKHKTKGSTRLEERRNRKGPFLSLHLPRMMHTEMKLKSLNRQTAYPERAHEVKGFAF